MKLYTPIKAEHLYASKAFQEKITPINSLKKNKVFTLLKCFIFLSVLLLFSYTLVNAQDYNINTETVLYDFSKASEEFQGLQIPDFLAFASENKEFSSEKFIGASFYPAEISIGFLYMDDYANYAVKEAEYLKLLEKEGFEYRTGWEGYSHYQKQWENYYVLVTTGVSYYEDDKEYFLISIALTKEPISFPF